MNVDIRTESKESIVQFHCNYCRLRYNRTQRVHICIHMCIFKCGLLLLFTVEGTTSKISPSYFVGVASLSLTELLSAFRVVCMGWEVISNRDDSLATILLWLTTSTALRGHHRTELGVSICLFSFFLLPAEILLPQPNAITVS